MKSKYRIPTSAAAALLLCLPPRAVIAQETAPATAAPAPGAASLRIESIKPPSPANLSFGEKLSISIRYENPGPGGVQIWARPYTGGKSTPGYGAHPSRIYAVGTGETEGWFTFGVPAEVDEIRVEMMRSGGAAREVVARTALPIKAVWAQGSTPLEPVVAVEPTVQTPVRIEEEGAFGFPQKDAKVLCDSPDLRFSVWNDATSLYAQAVLRRDGDPTLGLTDNNAKIGDWSVLMLELGETGRATSGVDRNYSLNPWPSMAGLHYQAAAGQNAWTTLKGDSAGRGAVRYVTTAEGRKVRVDSFLIPLAEISKKAGDTIRLAYWGSSPVPALTVNSTGFIPMGKASYSGHQVPREKYHPVTLASGGLDASLVPEDRKRPGIPSARSTAPLPRAPAAPAVAVGEPVDIAFTAVDGREVDLAKLRGKVVLIDFWATWCGPCIVEIPNVVEAYRRLHDKGFEIVGISFDHDRAKLEGFTKSKGMPWPQFFDGKGWQNQFGTKFGIRGIPAMWLVNKEGKLVSTNARNDLAAQVEKLLAE